MLLDGIGCRGGWVREAQSRVVTKSSNLRGHVSTLEVGLPLKVGLTNRLSLGVMLVRIDDPHNALDLVLQVGDALARSRQVDLRLVNIAVQLQAGQVAYLGAVEIQGDTLIIDRRPLVVRILAVVINVLAQAFILGTFHGILFEEDWHELCCFHVELCRAL